MNFDWFFKGNYKLLLILPVIIFILTIILSLNVPKGADLKGGTVIAFYTKEIYNPHDIVNYLKSKYKFDELTATFAKGNINKLQIKYSNLQKINDLKNQIDNLKKENLNVVKDFLLKHNVSNEELKGKTKSQIYNLLGIVFTKEKDSFINQMLNDLKQHFKIKIIDTEIREVGTLLSSAFYKSAIWVSIVAIIFIIIVIFLFFREIIPSIAVILAALMDVLGGLAGMTIFNIPLSLITIPALLMLIGYSVDTDVMLTTKLLKRKSGSARSRASASMKTGLTMTTTTIAALIVMISISYFYQITVIFNISSVLLFGLIVDIISTWFMNAPILLWYAEKKEKR